MRFTLLTVASIISACCGVVTSETPSDLFACPVQRRDEYLADTFLSETSGHDSSGRTIIDSGQRISVIAGTTSGLALRGSKDFRAVSVIGDNPSCPSASTTDASTLSSASDSPTPTSSTTSPTDIPTSTSTPDTSTQSSTSDSPTPASSTAAPASITQSSASQTSTQFPSEQHICSCIFQLYVLANKLPSPARASSFIKLNNLRDSAFYSLNYIQRK